MRVQRVFVYCFLLVLAANSSHAARYQRAQDGKTLVWNSQRGVAQEATWSGLKDLDGYATGEGTLTWYRLGSVVNSYTGKMVKGKFEGPVIRVQGTTRLQANFANGEIVSGWLEPGESASRSPTPLPNEQSPRAAEPVAKPVIESPTAFPTATPTPRPTPVGTPPIEPTAIPTPKLTPAPKPAPSPTSTPRPTATPTPRPTPTPTATASMPPTATPLPKSTAVGTPILRSTPRSTLAAPPVDESKKSGPIVEVPEEPAHNLELAAPASASPQVTLEGTPRHELAPSPPPVSGSPNPSLPDGSRQVDPAIKRQMIADLKRQTEFVLGEVRDVSGNFREVNQLDQVKNLPPRVSAHVSLLANQAREFRAKLGYQVTYYECLAEIQAVDTLVVFDEATSNIADKDLPSARKALSTFRARYSEPGAEAQKPLWRYLVSLFALCDRLKNEAESHLPKALSLETSGRKADALRELREVYRIYPNPVTAEKIKQLQNQLRLTP